MQTIAKLNDFLKRLIDTIQNTPVSLTYLILTFVGITLIRNYAELYASQHEFNLDHFIHYTLSYAALGLTLAVLFTWITRDTVQQTLRLVVPFFLILLVAPIVDLIGYGMGGQNIAYILESEQLISRYLTFFGPLEIFGITLGMRVEIALVLIGSLWLFYNKTKSLFKTIVGTWLMYSIIFAYIALPALFSLIALRLGLEVAPGEVPVTKIFFVITVITTLWFVFKTNAERFMLIVRDIRPLRWTHFQFMFILGVCLSVYFGDVELAALASPGVLFDWVFVVMSITCAWIYSIIINNLEDIEIDSVSNPDRLTVTGAINPDMYSSISWWVLFGSISSAALVGFEHMFLVLAFIAGYFLYSAPPLRLKRVLILSKGIIALNSMLLVTAGYAFLNIKETFTLPTVLLPIFLVGFTMLLNFIDLKDYAGDKQAGIKTLPVVVGMEWAKWIIGTSFIATYLSVYSITQNIYLVPALLLVGLAQYYLVTKEVWEEWKVLTLHLAILVPAFVYLLVM